MRLTGRRIAATSLLLSAAMFSACDDDEPTGNGKPPQLLGVQAAATGPTTVRVSFNSRAGDHSFIIERAQGATSTSFAPAGTVQAPATPGTVNFDDTGLIANTDYQYRVVAVRGTQQSDPSTAASVKTQVQPGQTIEVTQDITTSTTWTKNNTYVLKGFIHVANAATLTIEAGTRIVGDFNTLGSSLFVLRGAKINAIGTAIFGPTRRMELSRNKRNIAPHRAKLPARDPGGLNKTVPEREPSRPLTYFEMFPGSLF